MYHGRPKITHGIAKTMDLTNSCLQEPVSIPTIWCVYYLNLINQLLAIAYPIECKEMSAMEVTNVTWFNTCVVDSNYVEAWWLNMTNHLEEWSAR